VATKLSLQDLGRHGLEPRERVHWNTAPAELIELAVRRGEGLLTRDGAFAANTSPHTGRSPNDKFVVREPESEAHIWWGPVNVPLDPGAWARLRDAVVDYLGSQELFVRDVHAGSDPEYRLNVRAVSTNAWHTLFIHNMFIEPSEVEREGFEPGFTILHAPEFHADPALHGTRSGTFVVLNFAERVVLIGGTRYAGEMKKSVFTVLNYVLPRQGVLSMHCSANQGPRGDVALFFGLSGTGKTTLSTDPKRHLIGDDEHGWSDRGVFNFEGGNYAKVIRLSPDGEPLIYAASRRFGAILENVVLDEDTRAVDFDDDSITENTRSSYPITFIDGAVPGSAGGHPSHIVFLTADAFGVMPPIAKLSPEQAMYHFLSGYTAKVAGTERGVTEPKAAFSACFGAPFLPLPPSAYATMLGEKIARHRVQCWLVNTGWTGGPFGVGRRMRLGFTRAMVDAMLDGRLIGVPTHPDPVFGLQIPAHVPGVPEEVLDPKRTWSDPSGYDAQAAKLAGMFRDNFETFRGDVGADVAASGPR
jgi:phosphoenolpyruvate carboxykinase (ATP)